MMKKLTYSDAGVDIDSANRLIDRIRPDLNRTRRPEVLTDIGHFGGLFALGRNLKDPVLVSGTDGVGTKLKIASLTGRHDTVGIDLVAMCVNDIIVLGAEPLFFLDYFSTGKLELEVAQSVISGIATGCVEARCALIGGETAEMPGMYGPGEYDLAGFAVGVVEREEICDGSAIQAGDALLGLASSGLHSNGYSLARKVLFECLKLEISDTFPGDRQSVGEVLLRPTRIYVRALLALKNRGLLKGAAHITGGGLDENLPRILPETLSARIWRESWTPPDLFQVIAKGGPVAPAEMFRTFNMGIGMVVAVPGEAREESLALLNELGESALSIGEVRVRGASGPACEIK